MQEDTIDIWGAREHNLKDLNLELPREQLVVITGVSGSGKSSLAFDTLYAEGQRRYLETFSSYVRQFIGGIERPDVDKVNGLSPVIAIDQKTTSKNPRSTVGTVTELYDFLRLLYARASDAYSYATGNKMEKLSDDEIQRRIQQEFEGQAVYLLAPIVKGRKGHYREDLEKLRKLGFTQARIDGQLVELAPKMSLDRFKVHDIEAVVDQLTVKADKPNRLERSLKTALKLGKGTVQILEPSNRRLTWYCRNLMDPESGVSYDEPAPNSFSFNSPYGACATCNGLGKVMQVDEPSLLTQTDRSLSRGALAPLDDAACPNQLHKELKLLAKQHGASLTKPWAELDEAFRELLLEGEDTFDRQEVQETDLPFDSFYYLGKFIGLKNLLLLRHAYAKTESARQWAETYLLETTCPSCQGGRLKRESLHFRILDKNIAQLAQMDLLSLQAWLQELDPKLSSRQRAIATELLKEIRKRLQFLLDVGLGYLALDRPARSLSGGEAQRIRLATQIGSQLVGVLYILDEPSIGLHQRDNTRLITALKDLRDLGNSILVVEHDKEMMLESDYILDLGPGAGVHGGQVVSQGPPQALLQLPGATADFLSGRRQIRLPVQRREPEDRWLELLGAVGNNLKGDPLHLPLGLFVCVTGVSGSGKSSVINQTLYPLLHQHAFRFQKATLPYSELKGTEHVDKVIEIDQKPIGRTPRSNPATYTGLFTHIRELFANLPESKIRGYKPGRFSFNVKGGRCETCGGGGQKVIEMNFLPDVHVQCETCRGRRYNRETLEVRYKGRSIADVLEMTVDDALVFFEAIPRIKNKLQALQDVGLGYVHLGQAATTLSGGEAQRMKVATELSKRDTGRTVYILDEPTTGLHFQDIDQLIRVLNRLVDKGNTVLVIEHNLDVIKMADWLIDLGPEGGAVGGRIIAQGTPEQVAQVTDSHTGSYLKHELEESRRLAQHDPDQLV